MAVNSDASDTDAVAGTDADAVAGTDAGAVAGTDADAERWKYSYASVADDLSWGIN